MHKEEIILLHLIFFELKKMFEEAGFSNDFFSAYDRFDIVPAHIYKYKREHIKAILTLCMGVLEILNKQGEIKKLLEIRPSLKISLRRRGIVESYSTFKCTKKLSTQVKIVNVVVTGKIGKRINLNKIARELKNVRYNPNAFPGLTLSIDDPSAAILIFKSGKIVCTGTKCVEDAKKAVKYAINVIKKIGIDVKLEYIKVQNIVACANLGSELNLKAIALAFLENVEYEPEQFPALFYRLEDSKAVILVFSSGKVVIAGCKTQEDVKRAFENFCDKLSAVGYF
ncbi:hypothetical protein DRO97_09410 [Archaeoglobales archaeon]|nr:MAG: hypothetical protein DRO97_09410 [Archaeoglobales archaeon]